MEASGASGAEIPYKIQELNRRVDGFHKRIGGVEVKQSSQTTDIEVLKRDLNEVKGDVADIKKVVEEEGERNRSYLKWVITTLVGFSLTTAGSALLIIVEKGGT